MCKALRTLVFLTAILCATAVFGAEEEDPFAVDFFPGWDRHYRPMQWMPVDVGIRSELTKPFDATIVISSAQDGLNKLNIVHKAVLTPDLYKHMPLVTKLAYTTEDCTLKLLDERGRLQWQHAFDMMDFSDSASALTAVSENDILIGLVGAARFGVMRLENQAGSRRGSEYGQVHIAAKVPRSMPWDWTGYVCLDALILYDPDWSLFSRQQLRAVCQWIQNGGKLLLITGSHVIAADNPIAQMIPFELGPLQDISVSMQVLNGWKLKLNGDADIKGRPLTPKSDARLYQTAGDNPCLFATAYVGFGRVAVMGFDPALLSDVPRSSSADFWIDRVSKLLSDDNLTSNKVVFTKNYGPLDASRAHRMIIPKREVQNNSNPNQYGRRYQIGVDVQATNQLMEHLYNIPEMRPLSIWWVILLLTGLAVLLGPVDYLVLKRLDRLPLTWLTSGACIVLFTAGAYYGVLAVRGGQMQLRTISIQDFVEGGPSVWTTSYSGLFAPRSDDYRIEGPNGKQWWSGAAPSQQQIFGYGNETRTRRINCIQQDGGNIPYSLPVNIWTIQCLQGEWDSTKTPFTATVERKGRRAVLQIENQSEHSIARGFVVFSDGMGFRFDGFDGPNKEYEMQVSGQIGPSLWRYNGTPHEHSQSGRSYLAQAYEKVFLAQGVLQRTKAMDAYLAKGAAVICVEYEGPPLEYGVEGYSYDSHHIHLARQVVFPRQDNEGMGL